MNDENYQINNVSLEKQLARERSKLWTPELDKLLRKWRRQIIARQKAHNILSQSYIKRHYFLGVPNVILGTLTSTGTISTFQNSTDTIPSTAYEWIRLAIGIVGYVGVVLAATMTFMNYQEAAQKNKIASDDYGQLSGVIDSLLILPIIIRGDPVTTLKSIRDKYDELVKNSPNLPREYNAELGFSVAPSRENNDYSPVRIHSEHNGNLGNLISPISPNLGKFRGSDTERRDLETMRKVISEKETPKKLTPEESFEEFIKKQNNFDSDDEKEVCIGFDIDHFAQISNNNTVLSTAEKNLQRNIRFQNTMLQALQVEKKSNSNPPSINVSSSHKLGDSDLDKLNVTTELKNDNI
jgi:hypothetical protein